MEFEPPAKPEWTPTLEEVFQAQTIALNDPVPVTCDAVFIHGSCMRDDSLDGNLLETVLTVLRSGVTKKVVLNGLTRVQIREKGIVAYDGFEAWREFFLLHGIPADDIIVMKPSWHTAAESTNMLELAEQMGWTRIMVATQPWHILRCFLQTIAIMRSRESLLDVHCLTHHEVSWNHHMVKGRLGGGMVDGNLLVHAASELENITRYGNPPETAGAFTQNATIPQMFEYLKVRSSGL